MKRLTGSTAEDFAQGTVHTSGVYRWNSNGNVPFEDMLAEFLNAGLIDYRAYSRSNDARREDTAAFLAEYKKREANRVYTAEEKAEMRNAFGDDAVVVNAITGQRINL